jgi:hypothetical protein
MPALPAYSEAENIACGLSLEARGPVGRLALHQALGGRGERERPIAIWLAFVAQRDRFLPSDVRASEKGISPAVAMHLAEAARAMTEAVRTAEAERDTVHDLRAGMMQHAADAVLARNNALLDEVEAHNAEIVALRKRLGGDAPPFAERFELGRPAARRAFFPGRATSVRRRPLPTAPDRSPSIRDPCREPARAAPGGFRREPCK